MKTPQAEPQKKSTQKPPPTPTHAELNLEEEKPPVRATGSADQTVERLRQLPGLAAQRQISALQSAQGNQVAARVISQAASQASGVIQRHPPGSQLLSGTTTAEEGAPTPPTPLQAGQELPAPEPTTGGGPEAATPGGAATPGTTTAGPQAPARGETTAAPAPAPTGPAAAPPTTLSMPTLQAAYAQNALKNAFGSVANAPIIQGEIHIVASQAALYAEYDRICHETGVRNAAGNLWGPGDLAASEPAGSRTNAFASNGAIWIDATQTDPTATVHEMLHVNTNSNFRSVAGEVINEGTTQRFAVKAVQATGHSVVGSENTYQSEQGVVNGLVQVIGEPALMQAYFNDPNVMIELYDELMGDDSWDIIRRLLGQETQDAMDRAVRILGPITVERKIEAVNAFLDWWVSDSDLRQIQSILGTCSDTDRAKIVNDVQDRIEDLWSGRQRRMLRQILGVPPEEE